MSLHLVAVFIKLNEGKNATGGIWGTIGLSDRDLLKRMGGAINYRGTQDDFFTGDSIGLCAKFSETTAMLAKNESGDIWVALDGKIWNKDSQKHYLEKEGHRLSSSFDSELVAHLYEEYGDSCVERLRGSFAFALWDANANRLLLVKDHAGTRPLFYGQTGSVFLFGSEIKSLLQYEEMVARISPKGLDYFFSWGNIPAPATIFEDIWKLPPACILRFEDGKTSFHKYWRLDFSNIDYTPDQDAWCKRIYDTLVESVRIRLDDEPVGILLGGLDSSAIAAIIRRLTDRPIESFTLTYGEGHNEPYVRSVSELLELNAHERVLDPKDLIEIFPRLAYLFDDIKFDMAPTIPTYAALELANKYVKTIFTGDGADIDFWSFGWTPPEPWEWRLTFKIPRLVNEKILSRMLRRRFVKQESMVIARFLRSIHHAINLASLPYDLRPFYDTRLFTDEELEEMLCSRLHTNVYSQFLECLNEDYDRANSYVNRMKLVNKRFETHSWGVDRIERICSMFSMNSRTPYEDRQLRELAATIPPQLKQPRTGPTKYILRRTIMKYELLPREVVNQQKIGFGDNPVLSNWLRGELKEYVYQTIDDNILSLKGILDESVVRKILLRGPAPQIYCLLIFTLWYNRFF